MRHTSNAPRAQVQPFFERPSTLFREYTYHGRKHPKVRHHWHCCRPPAQCVRLLVRYSMPILTLHRPPGGARPGRAHSLKHCGQGGPVALAATAETPPFSHRHFLPARCPPGLRASPVAGTWGRGAGASRDCRRTRGRGPRGHSARAPPHPGSCLQSTPSTAHHWCPVRFRPPPQRPAKSQEMRGGCVKCEQPVYPLSTSPGQTKD